MYGFVFKNKLGALAFVGLTLAGVASLVGNEDNGGLLQQGVDTIQSERAAFAEQVDEMAVSKTAGPDDNRDDAASPFGQQPPELEIGEFGEETVEFGEGVDDFADPLEAFEPQPLSELPEPSFDQNLPDDEGEIIGLVVDADGN